MRTGTHYADQQLSIRLWAPHAKAVQLAGAFNGWAERGLPLAPAANGHWHLVTDRLRPGDEYQFVLTTRDGRKLRRTDPRARAVTHSAGNALVYDPAGFDWGADAFRMPAWNELVIYELHVGTFNVTRKGRPGTFRTAIARLDYLRDLGINCIEVMPVAEFAGDYSWGYNPAHPFAVESVYGGPDAFKEFIREAHRRGMAVILDVVYNHFGPGDLPLWQFDGWSEYGGGGIYFYNDWKKNTPWGDTRPDYGRPEVREYIHDNALLWLDEFRCDGLRVDMIPYIRHVKGDENPGESLADGYSLLQWINRSVRERFPWKITIAEDLHGHNFVTDEVADGGLGFGSQWDADFVHPVRRNLIVADDGQRHLGELSTALLRRYTDDAFHRVVYTESHDEVANGRARVTQEIGGDNVDSFYSVKRAALGAVLTLTSPGIPMLFQGQALLEDKWFSDQDPLDWSRLRRFNGIVEQYHDLIRLRRNFGNLTAGLQGQHTQLLKADDHDKVLAYVRWKDDPAADGVLVVLNFSDRAYDGYALGLDRPGDWHLRYNGDWSGYTDHNTKEPVAGVLQAEAFEQDGRPHRVFVNLARYGALVYSRSGGLPSNKVDSAGDGDRSLLEELVRAAAGYIWRRWGGGGA